MGKAEAVGAADIALTEREVWTRDALATSAIEGEVLNMNAVRSSVARRLGIATSFTAAVPRNVEGLLDIMEDAVNNCNTDLTEHRLHAWHTALFPPGQVTMRPINSGKFRTHAEPMQIVSGPIGRETVHYEAPPSSEVPAQMKRFINWFNESRSDMVTDGLVRAAMSHLWFESIHPFEDGNGRIGRAIVDMALSQDAGRPFRLHGLSLELQRQQVHYYNALNRVQRNEADPGAWCRWLIDTFCESCQASSALVDEALDRARFWSRHKNIALNERQRKVLNKMLDAGPGRFTGGMTPRKLQSMTKAASATATRDLAELVEKGLMVRRGAGRSTHYELVLEDWEWRGEGEMDNAKVRT
jgi:Fic family protein